MAVASLLLDRGADVNSVDMGSTVLDAAARRGKKDTVSLLLDRGADPNMVGGKYGTALAVAAYHGNEDTALQLLDRGADANIVAGKYGTALAAAAFSGKKMLCCCYWTEEPVSTRWVVNMGLH